MMILAVHVRRKRATDGHVTRARCDRRKIAPPEKDVDDFCKRYSGFASEDPVSGIECEHPIEALKIDYPIVGIDRSVSIRAPGSSRNQRSGVADNDLGEFR